jgi:hypothetical protein
MMRRELDGWRMFVPGEPSQRALARFLIAMDELRARLSPDRYPNLEVSDEGYLWFNVASFPGTWEVLAFPFGLGDLPGPALAVSFPHEPLDWGADLVETLAKVLPSGAGWILFAASSSREEILEAYAHGCLPPLRLVRERERLLAVYTREMFWSYFGLYIPAGELTVGDAEQAIRLVLAAVEAR